MANTPDVIATEAAEAMVEVDPGADAAKHVNPELFGMEPYQIVSIAMLVLIGIAIFYAKVHKSIAAGLDNKIAAIKDNLDEAKKLRAEAEALRDEYSAKFAGAEKDAAAMVENAEKEADAILAKAEADSKAMVERRKRMAEDKIAAAERDAVDEVKATAAAAAAAASRKLISERHDADADKALADQVIASI